MDNLKAVFAGNLIYLRTQAGMTQAELAEKIHYSDKSVSKWERAEALPDLQVAQELAQTFGVTVDFLITPHDAWEGRPVRVPYRTDVITLLSIVGVWTVALLVFLILFWTLDKPLWEIFLAAAPVSFIVLLVLNSVWGKYQYHPYVVSILLLGIFLLLYYILHRYVHVHHPWFLAFLWVPAQLIVTLSFRVRRRNKKEKDGN